MADWYIEYADVAVGADRATTITATDVAPFSNLARVPFGAQDSEYLTLHTTKVYVGFLFQRPLHCYKSFSFTRSPQA